LSTFVCKKTGKITKNSKIRRFYRFFTLKTALQMNPTGSDLIVSATEPQASARGLLNCLAVAGTATPVSPGTCGRGRLLRIRRR